MDFLIEDIIILIAKKVAEHGIQPLFSFMRTLKNHLGICRLPAVLRSLPPEHADTIHNDEIPTSQFNFLYRMLDIMYDVEPDVAEAKRILKLASTSGSKVAAYFLMMLDTSSTGGEEIEQAVSTFTKFFKAQILEVLRDHIIGWGTPY